MFSSLHTFSTLRVLRKAIQSVSHDTIGDISSRPHRGEADLALRAVLDEQQICLAAQQQMIHSFLHLPHQVPPFPQQPRARVPETGASNLNGHMLMLCCGMLCCVCCVLGMACGTIGSFHGRDLCGGRCSMLQEQPALQSLLDKSDTFIGRWLPPIPRSVGAIGARELAQTYTPPPSSH